MIELHLVGYTAELGHLVLDLATAQGGRYRLVVDADLFATVDELREERRGAGLPVGDVAEFAEELGLPAESVVEEDAHDPWEGDEAPPEPDLEPEPAPAPEAEPEPEPAPEPEPEPVREPGPAAEPAAWDFEEGADSDGASMPDDTPWSVRVVDTPPLAAPRDEDDPWDDDAGPWDDDVGVDDEEDDVGVVARLLDDRPAEPNPGPPVDTPPGPPADTPPEPPFDTAAEAPTVPSTEEDGRRPPRPLVPERRPRSRMEATSPPPRPAASRPEPALSPAEIQSRLRAGASVRSVARAAGVDEEWIRRWEVPILAERARVLDHARGLRLERPRLGRSRLPLGEAVERALAGRGVTEDDVTWEVSRRRRDGRWRIAVRYVWRGRRRSATWLYDAEDGSLTAASDTARDLGFVRRRR